MFNRLRQGIYKVKLNYIEKYYIKLKYVEKIKIFYHIPKNVFNITDTHDCKIIKIFQYFSIYIIQVVKINIFLLIFYRFIIHNSFF